MIGLTPHIEYVDQGSGPALVLVHGLGGNLQNWLANIPTLAAHHASSRSTCPASGARIP